VSRIKQYRQFASFEEVPTQQPQRTDSLYRTVNIDNNRIIDFRPLQELNAPQLVLVWTTPQSLNAFYSGTVLIASKQTLGSSDCNPIASKSYVVVLLLRHEASHGPAVGLQQRGDHGGPEIRWLGVDLSHER
jgi:hypothetical protein